LLLNLHSSTYPWLLKLYIIAPVLRETNTHCWLQREIPRKALWLDMDKEHTPCSINMFRGWSHILHKTCQKSPNERNRQSRETPRDIHYRLTPFKDI
jgi:hypothetical protein